MSMPPCPVEADDSASTTAGSVTAGFFEMIAPAAGQRVRIRDR